MERLLDGKCEACKADAPLVTAEEKKRAHASNSRVEYHRDRWH